MAVKWTTDEVKCEIKHNFPSILAIDSILHRFSNILHQPRACVNNRHFLALRNFHNVPMQSQPMTSGLSLMWRWMKLTCIEHSARNGEVTRRHNNISHLLTLFFFHNLPAIWDEFLTLSSRSIHSTTFLLLSHQCSPFSHTTPPSTSSVRVGKWFFFHVRHANYNFSLLFSPPVRLL